MKYTSDNSEATVSLRVPSSWREVSQHQLSFILRLMEADIGMEDLVCRCLIRFSGLRLEGRSPERDMFLFSVRHGRRRRLVEISGQALAAWMQLLDWVRSLPDFPVRPDIARWGGFCGLFRRKARALDAMFNRVPFAVFLSAEALYRRVMERFSKSDSPLDAVKDPVLGRLASLLYPGLPENRVPRVIRLASIYWMAGLKSALMRLYPDLYSSANAGKEREPQNLWNPAGDTGARAIRLSTESMVRALTRGDPLRREAVLALDTHAALNELDAIARENARLSSMSSGN
ncbi:MAG: hypothetical protein K2O24_00770 [Muribaculaceae bacterium]|nr:hypothetical protein [Muribaculaceae bacterium]